MKTIITFLTISCVLNIFCVYKVYTLENYYTATEHLLDVLEDEYNWVDAIDDYPYYHWAPKVKKMLLFSKL